MKKEKTVRCFHILPQKVYKLFPKAFPKRFFAFSLLFLLMHFFRTYPNDFTISDEIVRLTLILIVAIEGDKVTTPS